jgi:hypothetical protein
VPTVEKQRLTRVLGLMRPSSYVELDSYVYQRELWVAWSALCSFYVVAIFAIVGAVAMRVSRRGVPLFPLLVPIAIFLLTTLALYGETRFRSTAEPSFVILAAVGIETAVVRIARLARHE